MAITSRGTIRTVHVSKPPERIAAKVVKRITLAKRDGYSHKVQTIRGPSEIIIGRDVRLLVLSMTGEVKILWDAPVSTVISDAVAVEIE